MFELNTGRTIYPHSDALDFRTSINGLGLNGLEQAVFVFGNRRKDSIKPLGWDPTGFWLQPNALGRRTLCVAMP